MTNNLIPTINISSIVNKDFNSNKSIETINKIKKACINIGFFQVTGHGINKKNIKNICNVGNKFFKFVLQFFIEFSIPKVLEDLTKTPTLQFE